MTMLSDELRGLVLPTDRLLKLVWFAQFAVLGMYTFISFLISTDQTSVKQAHPELIFGSLACVCVISSLLLRRYLLSASSVVRFLDDEMPFWYDLAFKPRVPKKHQETLETLDETEQKLYDFSSRLLNVQLLVWGILSTAAISGMVLAVITHQEEMVLFFVIPVGLVLLTQFPSVSGLLEAGLIQKKLERKQTDE